MTARLAVFGPIIAVVLAAAIGLQVARNRLYQTRERETERILYVRSNDAMKRLTLDFVKRFA